MMHQKLMVQTQFYLTRPFRGSSSGRAEISLEERVGHYKPVCLVPIEEMVTRRYPEILHVCLPANVRISSSSIRSFSSSISIAFEGRCHISRPTLG